MTNSVVSTQIGEIAIKASFLQEKLWSLCNDQTLQKRLRRIDFEYH